MNNTDPVVQECMQRAAKIEFHPIMLHLQYVHEMLDAWMYIRHLDKFHKQEEREYLNRIQTALIAAEKLLNE